MAEYRIEHKRVHYDPTARILKLRKGENVLAEAKYSQNVVHYVEGKADREFTRRFQTTPAMELLMHIAHHNRKPNGTATLHFGSLRSQMQSAITRWQRLGIIDARGTSTTINQIETKLPPVELKK